MKIFNFLTAVIFVSLLLLGCSDMFLQLSDHGEVKILITQGQESSLSLVPGDTIELGSEESETIKAVVDPEGDHTYRWYMDGKHLQEEDAAELTINGDELSTGLHTLVVGVDTTNSILVGEVELSVRE